MPLRGTSGERALPPPSLFRLVVHVEARPGIDNKYGQGLASGGAIRPVTCTFNAMQHTDSWPPALLAHLHAAHGEFLTVERLGGMSVARVYRADFTHGSVVVKGSPRPGETLFYEGIAARLREAGVPIPAIEWSGHANGEHWLVMEYLPEPVLWAPAEAWRPLPAVITTLARLHHATRGWPVDAHPAPAHAWTDTITNSALRCLPAIMRAEAAPVLARLQQEAVHLSAPWCWISGDASPPNWAARTGGSPVLFDWELFRPGLPAADLAPTVPGMPPPAHIRLAAEAYAAAWQALGEPLPWSVEELGKDIAVAKAATLAMLLAAHSERRARIPEEYIARLVAALPGWLGNHGWMDG